MSSKETLNNKQLLRAKMRELSRLHPRGDSVVYQKNILNLPQWKAGATVLLYHPLPGEIDLMGLLTTSLSTAFIFPRIEGENLDLYRFSERSRWLNNPLGFQEPDPETWERISPGEIELAIVPGLAFDQSGRRLGRGKGFYDRLLGHPDFHGFKIGVCWPWQLVDLIPSEAHDIRMDLVISVGK